MSNLKEQFISVQMKNKNLRMENEKLKRSIQHKTSVVAEKDNEVKFLQKRIKELFGIDGFIQVMSHVDCPRGFNVNNFKQVHGVECERL